MRLSFLKFSLLASLPVCVAAAAHATSTTVLATDSIFAVDTNASAAASYGGTAPTGIAVNPGVNYILFANNGLITVNGGGNYNDPNGNGSAGVGTSAGVAGLSGISNPDGALVGVFLAAGGPSGPAPSTLDFNGTGATDFASLSPLLDQVFFVGIGVPNYGMTGFTQQFYVPTGATTLYLGLADACNYNGGPGCYGDNSGHFAVDYTEVGGGVTPPAVTPEPSSLILLGTGALGLAGAVRRRFNKA